MANCTLSSSLLCTKGTLTGQCFYEAPWNFPTSLRICVPTGVTRQTAHRRAPTRGVILSALFSGARAVGSVTTTLDPTITCVSTAMRWEGATRTPPTGLSTALTVIHAVTHTRAKALVGSRVSRIRVWCRVGLQHDTPFRLFGDQTKRAVF